MTARASATHRRGEFDDGIHPPPPDEWPRYLAAHGRSFSFASTLIPEAHRTRLIAVYAFCRFTDDLVDRGRGTRAETLARLDWWLDACEAAYHGLPTQHPMLRIVMQDMAASKVPFPVGTYTLPAESAAGPVSLAQMPPSVPSGVTLSAAFWASVSGS